MSFNGASLKCYNWTNILHRELVTKSSNIPKSLLTIFQLIVSTIETFKPIISAEK